MNTGYNRWIQPVRESRKSKPEDGYTNVIQSKKPYWPYVTLTFEAWRVVAGMTTAPKKGDGILSIEDSRL